MFVVGDTTSEVRSNMHQQLLERVTAHYGLPAAAVLLRRNVSATWRLTDAPYVVRVTPFSGEQTREQTLAEHRLLQWLHDQGFPTLPLADEFPLWVTDSFAARVSHWLPQPAAATLDEQAGRLIRRFHELAATYPYADEFPRFDVLPRMLARVSRPLPRFQGAVGPVRAVLEDLRAHPPVSRHPLGLIHADVYPNNMLRDSDGTLRLFDFELVCRGPREWDLAVPWVACEWMGDGDFGAFMAGYGPDQPVDPAWMQLALARASAYWVDRDGLDEAWYQEGLRRLRYWEGDRSPWRAM